MLRFNSVTRHLCRRAVTISTALESMRSYCLHSMITLYNFCEINSVLQVNVMQCCIWPSELEWVDRVKYLGCYFVSCSGEVDITSLVGKFYGSFNNNVLGKRRNNMLVKTYCLPMLLYCCEIWPARPVDLRSVDVAWNNAFRKIFNACWRESVKPLQFYCSC